jgi:uncharacterized membrane protein YjjB (DUF3815 family)
LISKYLSIWAMSYCYIYTIAFYLYYDAKPSKWENSGILRICKYVIYQQNIILKESEFYSEMLQVNKF